MVRRTERSGIRSTGPIWSNWGRAAASGDAGGFFSSASGGRLPGLRPPGAFGERSHVLGGDPSTWTAWLYLADIYTKLASQAAGGRRGGNRPFEGPGRSLCRLSFDADFLNFPGRGFCFFSLFFRRRRFALLFGRFRRRRFCFLPAFSLPE